MTAGTLTAEQETRAAARRIGMAVDRRWRLIRVIGVGGMAAVYLSTDPHGQRAAVKILHPELIANHELRQRFVREAELIESIDHPGRVEIYDSGVTHNGEPFFAMELLEGIALDQLWRSKQKRLPIDYALRIAYQVLSLLSACHDQGIIHRDLKPGNVFLTSRGRVKVLDFGIARKRTTGVEPTLAGTTFGTPSFLSPEQAMGREALDGRADLFSLGAILYTLVTGRKLHEGCSPQEAFVLAATRPAPSVATVAPELPTEVVELIDRALRWDRRHRFGSAAEMRHEVARVLEGLGAPASGPSRVPAPASPPVQATTTPDPPSSAPRDEATRSDRAVVHRRAFAALEQALLARWQHGERDSRSATAIDAFHQTLLECVSDLGGALSCSLLPHSANHGRDVVWDPSPPCAQLLHRLFAAGYRSLTIDASCSRDQTLELVTWLARNVGGAHLSDGDSPPPPSELWLPSVRLDMVGALFLADLDDPAELTRLLEQTQLAVAQPPRGDATRSQGPPSDDLPPASVARSAARRSARAAHALQLTPQIRAQLDRALQTSDREWEDRFVTAFAAMVDQARRHHQLGLVTGPLRQSFLAAASATELARSLALALRLGDATEACVPGLRRRLFSAIFDREGLAAALEKLSETTTDNAQIVATLAVQELLERLVCHLGGDGFSLVMEYLAGLDSEIGTNDPREDRPPPSSAGARPTVPPPSRERDESTRRRVARDRGVRVVLRLQRLLAASQSHDLNGAEVAEQLERSAVALGSFCARTGDTIVVKFAPGTVLVNGHLLTATRTEYGAALELGRFLDDWGYAEVRVHPGVQATDLKAFAAAFVGSRRDRDRTASRRAPSPRIELRRLHPETLDAHAQRLSVEDQAVRGYVAAILTMRAAFSSLERGRHEGVQGPLRVAQRLASLSGADSPALVGATAAGTDASDRARRAVNAAILSLSMVRQLTSNRSTLVEIALAALLFDVGQAHLGPLAQEAGDGDGESPPASSPVAISAGQALLAMDGIGAANLRRIVTVLEAQWHQRARGTALPSGRRTPSVSALVVATAHRYGELLASRGPGATNEASPDEVVSRMRSEATGPHDRAVLALLLGGLGLFARGTAVELSTGETGIVLDSPAVPADYPRPRVQVIQDATGRTLPAPQVVDLRGPEAIRVVRIVTQLDTALAAARREILIQPRSSRPHSRAGGPGPASPPAVPRGKLRRCPAVPRPLADFTPTIALDAEQTAALLQGMNLAEEPASAADPLRLELPPVLAPSQPPPPARDAPPTASEVHPLLGDPSTDEVTRQSSQGHSGISLTGSKQPASSGHFQDTPLDRVLVHLLDRQQTGTVALAAAGSTEDGFQHALFLQDGVPTKALVRPDIAPLAETLRDLGYVLDDDLTAPNLAAIVEHDSLLRTALVERGLVGAGELEHARHAQLRRRVQQLFRLPDDTAFSFFAAQDLIGGEVESPDQVSAFSLLTVGLREQRNHRRVAQFLKQLAGEPLRVHEEADLAAFEFTLEEHRVINALLLEPSVSELIANTGLDPVATRVVIHALTLTRSFAREGAPPPLKNRVAIAHSSPRQPVNGVA